MEKNLNHHFCISQVMLEKHSKILKQQKNLAHKKLLHINICNNSSQIRFKKN